MTLSPTSAVSPTTAIASLLPSMQTGAPVCQPSQAAGGQPAIASPAWQTVGSAEFGDGYIHPVVTRFHAKS